MDQRRYLGGAIPDDALASGKMAFISGPRQVGKTTLARQMLTASENYFSWDDMSFKRAWARSPVEAVAERAQGPIVLDEIHKDRRWKTRLKGLFDLRGKEIPIIVTGSARLDLYRRGGESLLGRFFPYRLHPFSVAECEAPPSPDAILTKSQPSFPLDALMQLGGFPEPLLGGSAARAKRWSRLRMERLIREDLRDLRAVSDLQAVDLLAGLLPTCVGSLLSINALREDVGVAYATVRAWVHVLEALYVCFFIRPYAARLRRALAVAPKLYLFDPLQLPADADGRRRENLVALHLLKACEYWTDTAQGEFTLRYVRDKEKREVDFLVLRDRRPWMMVECKSGSKQPSSSLIRFAALVNPPLRFQLVADNRFDRSYPEHKIRVMGYEKFLAGLV